RRALALCLRLLFPALLLPGCGAAGKTAEGEWTDTPEEKSRPIRETETFGAPPMAPATSQQGDLLGVRHDLMLSTGPRTARCACRAAEAGPPTGPAFFWTGGAPTTGPDAVVVAVGARGVDCPGGDPDDSRRRPSISAVDEENNDILIEIEDLPQGRP